MKRRKKLRPSLARTRLATVHSPTVPGAVERVERVFDPIEYLRLRFPLEHAVAARIRRAHETLVGIVGGSGDFERVRGAGVPGQPPAINYLSAATVLSDVNKCVTHLGRQLIEMVVCQGYTFDAAGKVITGAEPTRKEREYYGLHFREALIRIAEHWGWNADKLAAARPIRGFSSQCSTDVPDSVQRGNVVHATRTRVFRSR